MKTTTVVSVILGATAQIWTATALPTDDFTITVRAPASGTPFKECLASKKTFAQCQKQVFGGGKRDLSDRDLAASVTNTTTAPFHDCLAAGGSFAQCYKLVFSSNELKMRNIGDDENDALFERQLLPGFSWEGTFTNLGKSFGVVSDCYSGSSPGDKVGDSGWLTNTMVKKIGPSACVSSVNMAFTALKNEADPFGIFEKAARGYFDGNGGPIIKNGVHFFLTTFLNDEVALKVLSSDPNTTISNLCKQGIDYLTGGVKSCVTPKKAGGHVEHTAVNGGEILFTANNEQPQMDSGTGLCINCYLTMILEASGLANNNGNLIGNSA